jgi:hypothetical protein
VDGFSLLSPPPGDEAAATSLPMPVAWLYVLKDGRIIAPESTQGSIATFPAGLVTPQNPLTGRIAFWTDDETCKLDLNTASEAEPWDLPAANTRKEQAYSTRPPAVDEFHRLAAHPAFTSLSPVLRRFGGTLSGSWQWSRSDPLEAADASWRRYIDGYQGLLARADRSRRHFASVDEFFFDEDRARNGSGSGFFMEQPDLKAARFFLTTDAASPDLNPFGQPKIALWMVPQDKSQRTLEDRRVVRATAVGESEFLFQRASSTSSQSMNEDWDQVERNRELHAWLQDLTARAFPGHGGSFKAKYGAQNRDQILTSMLDMLRWSTNTAGNLPAAGSAGAHSAVPLLLPPPAGGTRGIGRFPTLTEVAVVFVITDVERLNGSPRDDNADGFCDRATKLRAFIVLDPFLPACGTPAACPAWSVRMRRLMQWNIGPGISPLLPGGNTRNRCTPLSVPDAGPHALFAAQFTQAGGSPKQIGRTTDPARDFPFISQTDVTIPAANGLPGSNLRFSGGRIIIDFMRPDAPQGPPAPNDSIHSVEIEFPLTQLVMPALRVSDFASGPRRIDDRLTPVVSGSTTLLPLIQKGDFVRSMILNPAGPSRGDARLLAARRELLYPEAAAWFTPHPAYENNGRNLHGIVTDAPATTGTLIAGLSSAPNAQPAVPPGLNGSTQLSGIAGDWESGPGRIVDGPFVRRGAENLPPLTQMPSAVHFGSLPTGVHGNSGAPKPWQTLLFQPQPAHFGSTTPPDHLWLEFFTMPVTTPRPLVADFSAAGRVNLNFQLIPFVWLQRATALHGVLHGTRLTAIPNAALDASGSSAKGGDDGSPLASTFRYRIDAEKTIDALQAHLDSGAVFRTASEICAQPLFPRRIDDHAYDGDGFSPPDPAALASKEELQTWWQSFAVTGDNLREAPYAQLHPRLCTQSNTWRVHYRVQLLQKSRGTAAAEWNEQSGHITAERRGSMLIRRFLPPAPRPDPALDTGAASLHTQHRFEIVNHQRLAP